MDPLLDDRALLDTFRRGDRIALEQVYHAYVDRIFLLIRHGFALRAGVRVPGVQDPHTQQDLVQEVFVKAFAERARLAYDGLRPYGPYLARIARNALIDSWRKHGAELPTADVEAALAIESDSAEIAPGDPADELHFQSLLTATRECVGEMNEEAKTFIRCRFEQDLAQRDVAEQMGITRRRVRTLEERVLSCLRKHLSQKGFLSERPK